MPEAAEYLIIDVVRDAAAPPRVVAARSACGGATIIGVPRSSRGAGDMYDLLAGLADGGGAFELVERTPSAFV